MTVTQFATRLGGAARVALRPQSPNTEAPDHSVADALASRKADYQLLDAWYDSRAYDERDWAFWRDYKSHHKLPAWIRPVFNPIPQAVDWYAGKLHRGAWTEDGRPLPDGTPHMLPVADDILDARPKVVIAAMQGLQWSNLRSLLPAMDSQTALHGNVFIEIQADLEGAPQRRKVKAELIPLWQIVDLELNAGGDVKRYVLEYTTTEQDGTRHSYRKTVDGERAVIERDNNPYRTVRHGYGFCPGVWIPFRIRGSQVFGQSLVQGVLTKIDRVNAMIATVEAYANKVLGRPIVIVGMGNFKRMRPVTEAPDPSGRETVRITEGGVPIFNFETDKAAQIFPLLGELNLSHVSEWLKERIAEIEHDLPEIVFDRELREMSQVTGPGVAGVVGDVRSRFAEVMANVDAGAVKIMQMITAIGCHHAWNGDWQDSENDVLTRQQAKFRIFETAPRETTDDNGATRIVWDETELPVGLDSFARGALDLAISPRALLEQARPEEGTESHDRMMQSRLNWVEGLTRLSDPQLSLMGLDDAQIKAIGKVRDEMAVADELAFNRGDISPLAGEGE